MERGGREGEGEREGRRIGKEKSGEARDRRERLPHFP